MSKRTKMETRNSPEQLQTRAVPLDTRAVPESFDESTRSVEIIAASEAPVLVYDYEQGRMVSEVLIMSGLDPVPLQVPLLNAHSRWNTSDILGSVRGFRVEDDRLLARAHFAQTAGAEEVMILARDGHLTDVSVGYQVKEYLLLEEGKSVEIEGKRLEGPLKVVTGWSLHEVSTVPIGADQAAKIRSAAGKQGSKEKKMNRKLLNALYELGLARDADEGQVREFMAALDAVQVRVLLPDLDDESTRALLTAASPAAVRQAMQAEQGQDSGEDIARRAAEAERRRIAEISGMCERFGIAPEQRQVYIDQGLSTEETRLQVLEIAAQRSLSAPGVRIQHGTDEVDKLRSAVSDGLVVRAGGMVGTPAPGHEDFRGFTLRELCREMLSRAGQRAPADDYHLVMRALSTSDLPNIFNNVANKFMMMGYDLASETWPLWCATGNLNDFRQASLLRATEVTDLMEVPEGGEYQELLIGEAKEVVRLSKYGGKFALTWEAIVNDDLNALTEIPKKMGRAALRKVGDVAYAPLIANPVMGDGKPLFHGDHGNLAASGSTPDVDSLSDAEAAIATQRDEQQALLNIPAQYFIAPRKLKALAEQFFGTRDIGGKTNQPNLKNIYFDYFTRIYEARLDAASTTAWYLAGPSEYTVKVFFLSGRREPFLDTRVGFDVDGQEFKIRQVVASKAMDYKALYKNPGA